MKKLNPFDGRRQKKSLPSIFKSTNENDKKEEISLKLESTQDFLEIFTNRTKQCFYVKIPEILIYADNGSQKILLSNTQIGKILSIRMKSVDSSKNYLKSLRDKSIVALYNQIKPKILKFHERMFYALKAFTHYRPIAMVKLNHNKKIPVSSAELEDYLRMHSESIQYVQEYVNLPQKSTHNSYETFYCEYNGIEKMIFQKKSWKYPDIRLNSSSKFYIPSKYRDKKISPQDKFNYNLDLSGFRLYSAFFQALMDYGYDPERNMKGMPKDMASGHITHNVYNSFDQNLNNKLNQICKTLMNFINSRNIEVKRMVAKFLYNNEDHNIYFIGMKELTIMPKTELAKNPGLNDLINLNIKEIYALDLHKPLINQENFQNKLEKKSLYSKKLSTILKKDICAGEFCNYIFGNYEKGGIEELCSDIEHFKELSNLLREDFHKNTYELSSNLLHRINELSGKLPSIFEKYKITSKFSEKSLTKPKPLLFHKNEYKMVKVCRNCYLIYSLLLKEFNVNELKSIKTSNKSNRLPHCEVSLKKISKQHILQYIKTDESRSKENEVFRAVTDVSLGLGLTTTNFSLKKRFYYPKPLENKKVKKELGSVLSKTFNLFKNTIMTRKGEISLNSMMLDKSHGDLDSAYLKSPLRDSLFGNPQKKSILFQPDIVKYNYAGNNSPKAVGINAFKKSFTTSLDEPVFHLSPKQRVHKDKNQARNSTFIDKKLANLPSYQIHKILNRKKFNNYGSTSVTHSIFHRTYDHLRKLPYFKINTPRISLLDGKKGLEDTDTAQRINIKGISDILEIECPKTTAIDIEIEVLVIDAKTAIPFSILSSQRSKEVKHKEILIICHDFFDNYLEKLDFYKQLLSGLENYILIAFNYPCQAYSLYNPETLYNNEYLSNVLDLLIYELVRRKIFHIRSDNIRFIGFGYGSNIILHFLSSINGAIKTIKACLLFNTFLYLDDPLSNFISNSINLLSNSKENMYSSILYESFANKTIEMSEWKKEEFSDKEKTSDIRNEGRVTILKGCNEIYNLSQNIDYITNSSLVFVNSSHNTLISNSQKNFIEKYAKTKLQEMNDIITFGYKRYHMMVEEAGYNIFKDQQEVVKKLINQFLQVIIPLDIDQRISFTDKLLLIVEENLKSFYHEEIENFNNLMEMSESLMFYEDFEKYSEIESDFIDIINRFSAVKERIEDLELKIEKCVSVFKENHDEIKKGQENDLIGKIMNIQQKKLNEFTKYLSSIKKEIENPLKNRIFILKATHKFLQMDQDYTTYKEVKLENLKEMLNELRNLIKEKNQTCGIVELDTKIIFTIKDYLNLKMQLKKKLFKYKKKLDDEKENEQLQNYIQKMTFDMIQNFKSIEQEIIGIFDILLSNNENIKNSDNILLIFNCVYVIIHCYETYFETSLDIQRDHKINLMNFGQKGNSPLDGDDSFQEKILENEVKQKIQIIALILPDYSQNSTHIQRILE